MSDVRRDRQDAAQTSGGKPSSAPAGSAEGCAPGGVRVGERDFVLGLNPDAALTLIVLGFLGFDVEPIIEYIEGERDRIPGNLRRPRSARPFRSLE